MRYLAIDYGTKHIGLATSEGFLAEPFDQISNKGEQLLVGQIARICRDQKISKIIVGISENTMAAHTQQFAAKLKSFVDIPVVTMDETLSTKTAQKYLQTSGAKRRKRQSKQHQTAAAVILQTYLEENNSKL